MTDINPDVPDTPIDVPISAVPSQVATGSRDIILLIAALPALVAVLGSHNVKSIVDWFASEQGLSFVGLVLALGTAAWRQWQARRKVADLQVLEQHVSDDVAKLK